jgi:hypothetical protein
MDAEQVCCPASGVKGATLFGHFGIGMTGPSSWATPEGRVLVYREL